jgi:hypothetical protein
MPHNLVTTLLKKSEMMIKKLATEEKGKGKPQVIPIYEFILNIILTNNLIPAWSELPEIRSVLHLEKNSPDVKYKDEMKLFEKDGRIKIKMRYGPKFFLDIEFRVPPQYPFA